jgi:hypothetical protein
MTPPGRVTRPTWPGGPIPLIFCSSSPGESSVADHWAEVIYNQLCAERLYEPEPPIAIDSPRRKLRAVCDDGDRLDRDYFDRLLRGVHDA